MSDEIIHRTTVRNRKNTTKTEDENSESTFKPQDDENEKIHKPHRMKLTLMEEILLLSIKEQESNSFFSDAISFSMRVCMLIELAIRGRIELEPIGARKRTIDRRSIIVVNNSLTGETLLDEALRTIAESAESNTVPGWLNLLSGETWNPVDLRFQLRNVRTRLAKGLTEKGICTISNINLRFFNITINPVVDPVAKKTLIKYVHDIMLTNWRSIESLDVRDFALISIAYATEILDFVLGGLDQKNYDLAYSRLKIIGNMDLEKELDKYSNYPSENKHDDDVKQIIFACLFAMYE